MSFLSFNIFGPNYLGLRVPALIAYIICLLIAYNIGIALKFNKTTSLALVTLMSVDPGLWYFGGTNHPIIFRCVGVLFFIFFFIKHYQRPSYVGFIASLCVFLTYPPNAFLILAGGLFYLFRNKTKYFDCFKDSLFYVLGVVFGIVISETLIFVIYERTAIIEGFWWAYNHYSNRVGLDDGKFKNVIKGLSMLINPPLLAFSITSIFYLFWNKIRKINLNHTHEIFSFIILSFLFQVIFLNDYPMRNMVIATPIFIITSVFFLSLSNFKNISYVKLILFFSIAYIISFSELLKHKRWISDYIYYDIILYIFIILSLIFLFKIYIKSKVNLTELKYNVNNLIFSLIISVGLIVNTNISNKLKNDKHSHSTLLNLAKLTKKGCVVGYGNSLYLAGGGVPLFFPHIHSPAWISAEMKRLEKNGSCKEYYLFVDFKKKSLPKEVEFYGRTWLLISKIKTDDIYNNYTLALWKDKTKVTKNK